MSDQWALQLLAAVIEFEDLHPTTTRCLADALERVPERECLMALGYIEGMRSAGLNPLTGASDVPAS